MPNIKITLHQGDVFILRDGARAVHLNEKRLARRLALAPLQQSVVDAIRRESFILVVADDGTVTFEIIRGAERH